MMDHVAQLENALLLASDLVQHWSFTLRISRCYTENFRVFNFKIKIFIFIIFFNFKILKF